MLVSAQLNWFVFQDEDEFFIIFHPAQTCPTLYLAKVNIQPNLSRFLYDDIIISQGTPLSATTCQGHAQTEIEQRFFVRCSCKDNSHSYKVLLKQHKTVNNLRLRRSNLKSMEICWGVKMKLATCKFGCIYVGYDTDLLWYYTDQLRIVVVIFVRKSRVISW